VCGARNFCLSAAAAADLRRLVRQIKIALKFASSSREINFSAKAAELWSRKYRELTADRAGLFGAATSRAEAQTRRIAAIYALMDESDHVLIQHLKAALEIWRYCEQSARFIFGQRDPLPIDTEILELLRGAQKKGVTLTEISAAFSRHRKRYEIATALERLKKSGKATCQKVATSGRAAQRWFVAES